MKSNTSRTLEYIRSKGWEVDRVEKFIPYAGKFGYRKDCFNLFDLIALGENSIIGIQSCGQSFAKHHKKILGNPLSFKWLECGGRIMLIGWRKVKLCRGGKAMRWSPRIKEYKTTDWK